MLFGYSEILTNFAPGKWYASGGGRARERGEKPRQYPLL